MNTLTTLNTVSMTNKEIAELTGKHVNARMWIIMLPQFDFEDIKPELVVATFTQIQIS